MYALYISVTTLHFSALYLGVLLFGCVVDFKMMIMIAAKKDDVAFFSVEKRQTNAERGRFLRHNFYDLISLSSLFSCLILIT